MKRTTIAIMTLVVVNGATRAAHAQGGFISAPLQASAGAEYACSVSNNDPVGTARVLFRFLDEGCIMVTSEVAIPPGNHRTVVFPPLWTTPVRCSAYLTSANAAKHQNLVVAFSVRDGGQTTAVVPMTYYKSIAPCTP